MRVILKILCLALALYAPYILYGVITKEWNMTAMLVQSLLFRTVYSIYYILLTFIIILYIQQSKPK